MAFPHSRARAFWSAVMAIALGMLAFGCKKSKSDTTAPSTTRTLTVSGTVNYTRIPLVKDGQGVPVGLETNASNFKSMPARGITVRLWVANEETDSAGTKHTVWKTMGAVADTSGKYSIKYTMDVTAAAPRAFVELTSAVDPSVSGTQSTRIRILSEPDGIDSPKRQSERYLYMLRKGVGGTIPSATELPGDLLQNDATVDFAVGVDTRWLLCPDPENALQQAVQEPVPTGSRVLGIADTFVSFATAWGNPAPPSCSSFDVHYRLGVSHPRGNFVTWDADKNPLGYVPNGLPHVFGTLRGGTDNDDAWDEAPIYLMAAQNWLFTNSAYIPCFPLYTLDPWGPTAGAEQVNLLPQMAFMIGATPALAANLLKTPYLADTTSTGIRVFDVRQTGTAPKDMHSAPNLRAFLWEVVLKANSLPSPGTPTNWDTIKPTALSRLFSAKALALNGDSEWTDVPSIYTQLSSLQTDRPATDVIDLKAIFTDSVVTALATPFGISWPRVNTGATAPMLLNWGTNFPPAQGETLFKRTFTFSMANAVKDAMEVYPNCHLGEAVFAHVLANKDQAYFFDVAPLPPSGATLEVWMGNKRLEVTSATSTNPTDPLKRFVVPKGTSHQFISMRFLSPTVQQPDYTCTMTLHPAP